MEKMEQTSADCNPERLDHTLNDLKRLETEPWDRLMHRCEAKAAGNSYSLNLPLPRQSFTRQLTIKELIKELKGGLHLGRMQVSQDAERVERSVVLPVCAYLLWIHLYGREQASSQGWSLFQLKQRFTEALMQDQVNRVEQKWRRKWSQIKEAA